MVKIALLAFWGEVIQTYLFQLSLVIQKIAHRKAEEHQKRNKVKESSGSYDLANNSDVEMNRKDEESEVDQDADQSLKTYCSFTFFIGGALMFACITAHVIFISYLDLTLLSAN